MPINPNIALSVRPPQIDNPVEKVLTLRNLAQQQQAQQQELEIRQQQLNELQRLGLGRQALAAAIKAHVGPDGTIDHEAVANDPNLANYPDQVEAWLKVATSNRENLEKLRQMTIDHATHQMATIGDLAFSSKDPQDFAAALGLLAATPGGGLDEKTAHQIADAASQNNGWEQLRQQYLQFSPKYQAQQAEMNKPMSVSAGGVVQTPARGEAGLPPLIQGPVDPAKAESERHNKAMEEIGRMTQGREAARDAETKRHNLAVENEKNAPLDIGPTTFTTMSGRKYVDLGEFQTPTDRSKAQKAAIAAGVMPVNKDVADGLRAADTARTNFQAIWGQLEPYLPKDAAGRLIGGPKNTLAKIFQANPMLGAYGSWRTAAVQAVQALAEKGMGLRLNRAEIDLMLQNDIPQITDDTPTAKQRVDNMMRLLDNKEENALRRDRSGMTVPDLSGLPSGRGRKFTDGPFKGQTWTIGPDGLPMQVQ